MIYFIFLSLLVNSCWGQATTATSSSASDADATTATSNSTSDADESPCPDLDISCIQDYFNARYAPGCGVVSGTLQDPLPDNFTQDFYDLINATLTSFDNEIANFSTGEITAFFNNSAKNITGIEVTFYDLVFVIGEVDVEYYRPGQSPAYGSFNSTLSPGNVSITIYFRGVDSLDLRDSFAYSYVLTTDIFSVTDPSEEELAASEIGPIFPVIDEFLGEFVKLTLGPTNSLFLGGTYIQSIVCDFGVTDFE